ncbi:phage tail tape measure protein [Streptomyces sp. NPDC055966]|uniref:phage tail tape measure protein n=1 Tax=Streptomyces sp. NPDC055966 TaxID=3345669 RepID=UPI0035D63BFB
MAGAEMFTVLAVLEARDRISGQLEKAEGAVGRFSESLQRMAGTAEEAGARTDEALLQTASGTDAVELADARLAAARDKLTAATERQAEAERALLEAQGSIASEESLAAAADKVAGAEERAAAAAQQLKVAQDELAAAKEAEATEAELGRAAEAVQMADERAALAVKELTAAQKEQAALVTRADVVMAADALAVAEKRAAVASGELTDAERVQADTAAASAAKTDEAAAAQGRFSGVMAKGKAVMAGVQKAAMYSGVAVAAIGYESIKAARTYESSTTRLVTSAGETNDKLNMVRQGMVEMAGQVGVSADDLSKAMYYVEAAGYHAADGLTVLKAAAQGAAAEGADTTTVAQALTDVLKDYHMKASAAADVTSKMITAVAHGKTNLQDFSAAFASIVPAASGAGISFNDVGAALANMTNHGFTASRASQNLAQALRSLLNPTTPMKKAFDEFGVSADTLKSKLHGPNGLTDAMQYLSEAASKAGKEGTPEFAAALKRLMGTAPGANAALSTVGANMKDTNDTIKAMSKSTADAHGKVKGFAEVQQTLGFKMASAKAAIQSTGIAIGTALLPMVTKIFTEVNKILLPLAEWAQKHQKLVMLIFAGVGAFVAIAGAIKLMSIAMGILNTVMEANPIALIIIAIAALVGAFIYCWDHFKSFRDFWKGAWKDIQGAAEAGLHFIEHAFASIVGRVESAWAMVRAISTGLWHWFVSFVASQVRSIEARIAWFGHLGSMFAGWMSSVSHAVSSGISTVVRFFENLPHTILSLLSGAGSWLVGVGVNLVEGLWNGIASMGSWLYSQISGWIKSVVPGPVLKVLGISSPSKWAHWAGQMVGQGLANGVLGSQSTVATAANQLAKAVTGTAAGTLSAGLTVTGTAVPAFTGTPGLVGGSAAGGGAPSVVIDIHGNYILSDADTKKLADRISQQIPHALAAAGVRIRG